MSSSDTIRVGIVDDSPFMRALLRDGLERAPGITVAFEATDPYAARALIKQHNPDVLTLDIEMPRMNGLDFLEKIMTLRPMPVIMVSSLTQRSAEATIRALEIGAADTVGKPQGASDVTRMVESELVPRIRAVAFGAPGAPVAAAGQRTLPPSERRKPVRKLAGIASSTGGIERLRRIGAGIRGNIPPTLVVQHINYHYVSSLAGRLDALTPAHISVRIAADHAPLEPNTIYIADNRKHLTVKHNGHNYRVRLEAGEPVNGFIASADKMFESMAREAGDDCAGIVLSGMGNDGAAGLLKLFKSGGVTIGESEASCLVYGMPKAAADLNALSHSMSLGNILEYINGKL